MINQLVDLFKLRIGIIMAITALVAMIVTPGQMTSIWDAVILSLAVLLASASAGAFNGNLMRICRARASVLLLLAYSNVIIVG
jgi:heme O synthase-like polyprenyltransferase